MKTLNLNITNLKMVTNTICIVSSGSDCAKFGFIIC